VNHERLGTDFAAVDICGAVVVWSALQRLSKRYQGLAGKDEQCIPENLRKSIRVTLIFR
jgi:hypothetical protein